MTRSDGQAGGTPSPSQDPGDSRCCQLIAPLSGKGSAFPLPAHTFLPGGRKCSWQRCRQSCPCLCTCPCHLPGNRGARSASLRGCLPLLLPDCSGHPPGHRPCPRGAWQGVGSSMAPTAVPLINTPGTAAVPPAPECLPHPSPCGPGSSHATLCGTQGWQGTARQGLGTRCLCVTLLCRCQRPRHRERLSDSAPGTATAPLPPRA